MAVSFACGIAGIIIFAVLAPLGLTVARRAGATIAPVAILGLAAIISHAASILLGTVTVAHFQYWNAASIFGFGVMLYVFAFGAVYKSVSLEILLDVAKRPGASAPLADIIKRTVPEIFRGRTDILVDGGQVARRGPAFVVTAAGEKIASRIAAMRRAFAVGDTGLYDFAVPAEVTEKSPSS